MRDAGLHPPRQTGLLPAFTPALPTALPPPWSPLRRHPSPGGSNHTLYPPPPTLHPVQPAALPGRLRTGLWSGAITTIDTHNREAP